MLITEDIRIQIDGSEFVERNFSSQLPVVIPPSLVIFVFTGSPEPIVLIDKEDGPVPGID
jgi:hypothetical protein